MSFLDEILAQPGFSPSQLAVGAVMYLAWTAAYVHIIWKGFKDKSYGVPWSSMMLNVCWEALFSFNLTDAKLFWFFLWGNRLWLVFDLMIVYQFFRYGREVQVIPLPAMPTPSPVSDTLVEVLQAARSLVEPAHDVGCALRIGFGRRPIQHVGILNLQPRNHDAIDRQLL